MVTKIDENLIVVLHATCFESGRVPICSGVGLGCGYLLDAVGLRNARANNYLGWFACGICSASVAGGVPKRMALDADPHILGRIHDEALILNDNRSASVVSACARLLGLGSRCVLCSDAGTAGDAEGQCMDKRLSCVHIDAAGRDSHCGYSGRDVRIPR